MPRALPVLQVFRTEHTEPCALQPQDLYIVRAHLLLPESSEQKQDLSHLIARPS